MSEKEPEDDNRMDSRKKATFGGSIVGALLIGLILGVALGGGSLAGMSILSGTASDISVGDTEVEHISNSGEPVESVSVERNPDENTVSIDGTVVDGACDVTELGSVEYDAEDGTATVNILTRPEEGVEMCTMEIVGVEYKATIGFEGDLPETVNVVHNGEETQESE